jgi:hypothetical protein
MTTQHVANLRQSEIKPSQSPALELSPGQAPARRRATTSGPEPIFSKQDET